ncbi:acyl-CoA thioesterase II [Pseudooceanicola sp. CBS1P-1]|uniref:Acyl-CoA thioesterase 2 n=1 Tax=Pseudooceanicola albus TaxID=2692189 RepID=A0A6L7G3V9_9RHOB|nr:MULTISPECIES: acyl-CoA thioesterase II [Pseudooceanicola]MBT9385544.1 acyl-CoA thioesterase II [Pseudooceanicola endophyticus]MXN19044.1 acyl-CoA thioesterase II [Pseudooceanicola albus]
MSSDILVPILDVETIEQDYFRGIATPNGQGRSFGGQVISQALAAATRTVEPERPCHSLHAYFMRPGDATQPVLYQVNRDMEGRSFSTRRVVAIQAGRPILTLSASFNRGTGGMVHQDPMPEGIAPPEDLPSDYDLVMAMGEGLSPRARAFYERNRPIEIRPATPTPPFADGPVEGEIFRWMRARQPLGEDPGLHRTALAYASDLGLLPSALWKHGRDLFDEGNRTASLDHALWFHDDFRMDDWLLYGLRSSWAGRSRGLCEGRVFTREGQLVASVRQEALLRVRD